MKSSNNNNNPNQKIEHITEINAPIETVWEALIDVNDWDWNKWTRLEAGTGTPTPGLKGNLRACYEGNDKDWKTFDFEFTEVNSENHLLAWKGSVGGGCLFLGNHVMRLQEMIINDSSSGSGSGSGKKRTTTRLIHTETFSGLLPFLKLGLPYDTLNRNYRLMNESLKEFVEEQQNEKK